MYRKVIISLLMRRTWIPVFAGMTLGLSLCFADAAAENAVELAKKQVPASMRPQPKPSSSATGGITVRSGDTVYGLAKQYGISAREIINTNNLKPPYILKVGQQLKIPTAKLHKVARGDTLYDISRTYGVDMNSIVKENRLQKPYQLMVGQKLKIPLRSYGKQEHKLSNQKKVKTHEIEFAPRISKGQFMWPLKGRVISSFGAKEGGVYNDGINIAASENSKVYAAAGGEVVYAGDEIKGYGNLVILKHKDGWITAYAHNRGLTVVKGQKVQKGQLIAYVGQTGNVTSPQLYFAIRKGRKALDPKKYLPA